MTKDERQQFLEEWKYAIVIDSTSWLLRRKPDITIKGSGIIVSTDDDFYSQISALSTYVLIPAADWLLAHERGGGIDVNSKGRVVDSGQPPIAAVD